MNTTNTIFLAGAAPVALSNFNKVVQPIVDLINSLVNPALLIVGALGALYCIFLGVKYARADEPQEHEKAKKHLKNAIIGFVLIFILMVALKLMMPIMQDWVAQNATTAADVTTEALTVSN